MSHVKRNTQYFFLSNKKWLKITELKEYFSCVQLACGRNPETTIIMTSDHVDVYKVGIFYHESHGIFPQILKQK